MPNPSPGNGESWFKWALIWFFRILIGVPVILAIPFRESAKFLKEHVYDKKHPIRRRICGAAFGVLLGAGASYYLGLAPGAAYSNFGFWWYPTGLAIAASVYFYAFPIVFGVLESVYEFARPYFDQLFTAIWNVVSRMLRGVGRVIRWFFRKLGSVLRWFWDSWAVVFENAYNPHHSRLVLHQVNIACALAILLGGTWYGSIQAAIWLSALYITGAVLAAVTSYLVVGSFLVLAGNWLVGAAVAVCSGFLAHHYLQALLPSSWAIGVSIGVGFAVFGVIYPLCCEAFRKSLQTIGLYAPLERALVALHIWAWRTLGNLFSSFWRAISRLWNGFWNVLERIWTRLMSVVEWLGNKWFDAYRAAYRETWQSIAVHLVNLIVAVGAVVGGIWFALSLNSQLLVVLAVAAAVFAGLVLYLVLGSILLALGNRFVGLLLAGVTGYFAHGQLQVHDSTWATLGGIAAGVVTYLLVYPVVCATLIKVLQLVNLAEGTLSLLNRAHNNAWERSLGFLRWADSWISWGWTQLCLFADWLGGWIAYFWNQFVTFVRWVGRGIAHAYRYVRKQVRRFLSWSWTQLCRFANWAWSWIVYGWTQLCRFADWLGGWIAYFWNQFVTFVRWVGRGIAHAYRYVRKQLKRFFSWSWTQLCRFANWAWSWIVYGWIQLCRLADWLGGWIAYFWNQFVTFVRWVGRGIAHAYRYVRKQVRSFLSWSWTKLCQFGAWLRGWIVYGWTQLCRLADWLGGWIAYVWNQFVTFVRWVGRGIAHAYRYVRKQVRRFLSWSWTQLCRLGAWLRGWISWGWNQFVSFVRWVGKWWGRLLDAAYGMSGQQAIILHLANIGTAGLVLYAGIQLSLSLTVTWLVGLSLAGAVFAAFTSYLFVGVLLPSLRNWTVGLVISAAFGYWLYDFHLDLVEPRIAVIAATVGFLQTFLLVYPLVCALFLKVLSLVRLAEPLRRLLDRAYSKAWRLLGDFWNALGRLARYVWTKICHFADWLWRTIVLVWNKFASLVRRFVNLLSRGWRQFLRAMDYCWRQFVVFLGFVRRKAGEILAGLRRLLVRFWNFVKPAFRVLINAYNTTYRSESQELILHSTNIAIAVALSGLGIFLSLQLSSPLWLGLGIAGSLLTGWIAYLWFGAALVRIGNWMVGGAVTVVAAYAAAMHFLPSGMLLTAGAVAFSGLLTFFVLYPLVCASLIGVLKVVGLESGLRSLLKSMHQSLWNRAAGLRGLVAETYVGIRDGAAKTAREARDWVYALWNRSDRNRRNDQEEDREQEEEPRR